MLYPKMTKAARGCLIHFIKGHLLEASFDKTFLHYFGIDEHPNVPDLKLWTKTPLSYLSEKDLLLLLNYRGKLATKHLNENTHTSQLEFLEWCEVVKSSPLNKSEKIEEALAIWKAHTLLLLALKSEKKSQRKILKVALEELTSLTGKAINTHPYIFYLRGLLNIALGNWDTATSLFHQAATYTHNPSLYLLLTKLYIHLEMPKVSAYFQEKLKKTSKKNSDLLAS